jgi:hypothetical protein
VAVIGSSKVKDIELIYLYMEIRVVNGRPIPKEPLSFFQYNQGSRYFVSVADSPSVWRDDLVLGERFFSEMIICPYADHEETHSKELALVKDVLKQRMKYPGVKEDPVLEKLAKTWILPTKVSMGPHAETFLASSESSVRDSFEPLFKTLNNEDSMIHILKLELNEGKERAVLYKILDNGFRPSLVLVKWSHDLDDHISTAHCAGHLLNSGYSLVSLENGYALYMFSEQTLYDITSMKTIGLKNPMMESILSSVSEYMKLTTPGEITKTE